MNGLKVSEVDSTITVVYANYRVNRVYGMKNYALMCLVVVLYCFF